MAKRRLKEKEIIEHLKVEGFKEVGANEKKMSWYKKASEKSACLIRKAKNNALSTNTIKRTIQCHSLKKKGLT
jgi:hypothetical protein